MITYQIGDTVRFNKGTHWHNQGHRFARVMFPMFHSLRVKLNKTDEQVKVKHNEVTKV